MTAIRIRATNQPVTLADAITALAAGEDVIVTGSSRSVTVYGRTIRFGQPAPCRIAWQGSTSTPADAVDLVGVLARAAWLARAADDLPPA